MIECADERRIVEMSRISSSRLLTPGAHVGCTRNTSLPHMFSRIWIAISLSAERLILIAESCVHNDARNL